MKLSPTNVRLAVLQAASDGAVVCHPAWSHHAPGWGWASGGDVALDMQNALSDLHHARLIDVNTGGQFHVDGDPVRLTAAGVERLAAWRSWATRMAART